MSGIVYCAIFSRERILFSVNNNELYKIITEICQDYQYLFNEDTNTKLKDFCLVIRNEIIYLCKVEHNINHTMGIGFDFLQQLHRYHRDNNYIVYNEILRIITEFNDFHNKDRRFEGPPLPLEHGIKRGEIIWGDNDFLNGKQSKEVNTSCSGCLIC